MKTFSKLRYDMYNSSERSYRAKRKIPTANQIGVQKNAEWGRSGAKKKGKHPSRRSLTAAMKYHSKKQMDRVKAGSAIALG